MINQLFPLNTGGKAENRDVQLIFQDLIDRINTEIAAIEADVANAANKALSNLASVAINTTLVSDTNNTDDIGSSGIKWRDGWFSRFITVSSSQSGGIVSVDVSNTATASGSSAAFSAQVGGDSAGDAYYLAYINGGTNWSWGLDNSDSNAWVLSRNVSLGTNNCIRVDSSSGAITLLNTTSLNSTKITSLANGTATTDAAAFGQIKYIQAPVQGTKTSSFSTTSSTYQATGLTATITPTSSSNRVKITVSVPALDSADASAAFAYLTIKRDSTDLSNGGNGFASNAAGSAIQYMAGVGICYIDSPATTSATTYELYLKNDNNATTVRINFASGTCAIILEEVV